MKRIINTLTKILNFRREYIFSAAGVLCVFFLLTAISAQNSSFTAASCQFENDTIQWFIVPQTSRTGSVLRGTLRSRRSVSQLRSNEFSKDIILSEKSFNPETGHAFIVSFSNTVYFKRFYTEKSNPVRAGPVTESLL